MLTLRGWMLMACVFVIFVEKTSGIVELKTKENDGFVPVNMMISDQINVVFEAKGCGKAILRLQENLEDATGVDIELGCPSQPQSCIRDNGTMVASEEKARLNCFQFHFFWISILGGSLRVGTGKDISKGQFLRTDAIDTTKFRFIFICMPGFPGWWIFFTWCSIGGDPHIESDDGRKDYFGITGRYICKRISHTPLYDIECFFKFPCRCLRELSCHYMGHNIMIDTVGVNIDGIYRTPPYFTADFKIAVIPYVHNRFTSLVLRSDGVAMAYDGRRNALLFTPLWFFRNTMGLCGTFTGIKADDWLLNDGVTVTNDKDTFTSSWLVA